MSVRCVRLLFSCFWVAGLPALMPCTAPAQSSNGVLREVYENIGGVSLRDLTNHASFPDTPTLETIEPVFEAPTSYGDNYGTRMRALLVPPATGSYTFWIATDDNGALYLSTTESPAQKTQIATVNSWTSSREWTKEPNQQSAPVTLQQGKRYFIEALQKEGGGGDNLAVRWRLPDGTIEEPIPNNRLIVFGLGPPMISVQPENQTVVENQGAVFEVRLERTLGVLYQWLRDNVEIPGATNSTYRLAPVSLADSGARFRCLAVNSLGTVTSDEAVLTVVPDTTRPGIATVGNLGDSRILFVVFSEAVEASSATNAANYAIDGGVTVERVSFGVDDRTVILTTSAMAPEQVYRLTVSHVRDRATVPNEIAPGTEVEFEIVTRALGYESLYLPREALGPSSRGHGMVISEVMYHPADRADGRDLEFVEIYNSQPWFEELGGWRISGAVDYVFPEGTVLEAARFLVVAANPADVEAEYGISGVLGPFENGNGLQNGSGTLRLRNRAGAVHFEMTYTGEPPFPASADGAGHSLVLARPSYGERDARAWDQSERPGGSPGRPEPPPADPWQSVRINEFLAHTDPPQLDFIELYNYRNGNVNLGGCSLSDDPGTNKFVVPPNTILPPRSVIVFTEEDLGFRLSSGGETIFFRNPLGTVTDAVRFEGQENGVSTGRFPDGASRFSRLAEPTPGSPNSGPKPGTVRINEIMFDPASSDPADEYVELYNAGTGAADLGGWRLREAVSFDIPTGTILPAGGYLVIARDATHLRQAHPQLDEENAIGDFGERLGNRGERIRLSMPDKVVGTNALGQLETNLIHVVVDDVTYGQGGRWGRWAGGGGSSLELRDPRSDGGRAPNWANSDESGKSDWVTVEATGLMDHGWSTAHQLHVTLLGEGEMLVDNIEVIPAGGVNLVANGTFDSGTEGWVFQGNHNETGWEPAGGVGGSGALHVRANGSGDTGSNRIRTELGQTLSAGTTVTLRARARWLKGNPNLHLRLRGNYMEAVGYTLTATDLGTPGLLNSCGAGNAPPAITRVRHDPVLPGANEAVRIIAEVDDADGLSFLTVNYRIDPDTNYTAVAMTNNGAGLYSAALPGRVGGTTMAFFLHAADNFPMPASSSFPDDAPKRECVVRWGDTAIPGTLGTYRLWLTQRVIQQWDDEEKMSNNPKDLTFIYNTERIIYNAGGFFHGSPYHSPSYNSPVGNNCDYDFRFPVDDRLLGETDINLFRPGNGGGDSAGQREIHGNWLGHQFGIPHLYHRPVFVYVNGQRRLTIYHDAQQPNGDFIRQWYPGDAEGELHKVKLGFEFGDQAYGNGEDGYAAVGANLRRYLTVGGVEKTARYRQTWPLRSVPPTQQNSYSNLFELVEAVNTSAPIGSDEYTTTLTHATDVEEWYKVHVVQHLYNNRDSFSYGGGQNAFAYLPQRAPWQLLLWDIDFAFTGNAADGNLTGIGGADHGPRNNHPPFARLYWQLLIEAAEGMLTPERSGAILDARYNGMQAAGANVGSPQPIKDFIATRRGVVLSQIAANQSVFAITSNGGNPFESSSDLVTLAGTAPLEVSRILVNGTAYAPRWTSLAGWEIIVPLAAGVNDLVLTGEDRQGRPVPAVSGSIAVTYTGTREPAAGHVLFSEIMYDPVVEGGGYVEIYNASTSSSFDLSRWIINGVDFVFPDGSLILPGAYIVVAENEAVFAAAYGPSVPVLGVFNGRLDRGGETLTLIQPGPTPAEDVVIDKVKYDNQPPWPAGQEPFIQLIDPTRDNARPSNWSGGSGWRFFTYTGRIGGTRLYLFLDQAGDVYIDNLSVVTGAVAGVGMNLIDNGDFEAPFGTPWTASGSHSGSDVSTEVSLDGNGSLHIVATGVGGGGSAVIQNQPLIDPDGTYTMSFWFLPKPIALTLTARFGSSFRPVIDLVAIEPTPGAANPGEASLPPYPLIWLNEVQPINGSGIMDNAGEREPWIELYNSGTEPLALDEYFLSDDLGDLIRWRFPEGSTIEPGRYGMVWADGETGESLLNHPHAGFILAPGSGVVALSRLVGGVPEVIDYLRYRGLQVDQSYGSFPNGQLFERRVFLPATPGLANEAAPVTVTINEWMAQNDSVIADPADNDYEDWFELYNPGPALVDLSGFYLSDDFADPKQWRIPAGTTIGPGGFLLVWADDEEGQNAGPGSDLHAGFRLAQEGEQIGLWASDGTFVDGLTFSGQSADKSEGRFPDGGETVVALGIATPKSPNILQGTLVQSISRTGNAVTLSFPSTPGVSYAVQYKNRLDDLDWTPLGGILTASGPELSVQDVIASGQQRFYRVARQ